MSFRRLISLSALFPALLFLGGCSGNWGWYVVNPSTPAGQRNLLFLLDGLYYTIALSVTAILISIILGLLVALPGLASQRPARVINRVYVELVRAVPNPCADSMGLLRAAAGGQYLDLGLLGRGAGAGDLGQRLPGPKFSVPASSRLTGASTRRHIPSRSAMSTRCAT